MSESAAMELVKAIASEFGFDPATGVVVRHDKPRRDQYDLITGAQGAPVHWHLLVPEVDPVKRKVLDSRWMYPRHERLAREAEIRLQHKLIKGRFNTSVIQALHQRGDNREAQILVDAGLADGRPARAAYTSAQRRMLERSHGGPRGGDLALPMLVHDLQKAWAGHRDDRAGLDRELKKLGLRVRQGSAEQAVADGEDREVEPAPATWSTGWVVDGWDYERKRAYVIGALHTLVRETRHSIELALRTSDPEIQLAVVQQLKLEPSKKLTPATTEPHVLPKAAPALGPPT